MGETGKPCATGATREDETSDQSRGPLLLIAGGSGVVPLMSMIRHRMAAGGKNPRVLLYSSRSFEDVIYYDELERLGSRDNGLQIFYTLTRSQPTGRKGYARRIDEAMLKEVSGPLGRSVQAYICGPTGMVGLLQTHS